MAILKNIIYLIRLPNLIIIALTQFLVYHGIMLPVFKRIGINSDIGSNGFLYLLAITIIIALGGYIINDLLDVRTDIINKPEKQVIGKTLSLKHAKWIYLSLFGIGFLLSVIYAFQHDVIHLLFIYPLAFAALAFYSYRLKNTLLLGNVVVAGFSAFVVGIMMIFDAQANRALKVLTGNSEHPMISILYAFMLFAFVSSLVREIVKDIEDYTGDKETDIRTTAVVLGKRNAKILAIIAGIFLLTGLVYWIFHPVNQLSPWLQYYAGFLAAYKLLILFRLATATQKSMYGNVSRSIKMMMAAGLLYLFMYSLIL